MGRDLFSAPRTNGHSFLKPIEDPFRYICGVFSGNGAVEVIKRAYENDLKTFFPIRRNHKNEYVPLWSNYLFIEFRESITIDLCRTTTRFIKVISERDEDGISHPVLIRKEAIEESVQLMKQGKFDDVEFKRKFRGRGSIVRVIDGVFHDKTARLEIDVTPEMSGNQKIRLDISGLKVVVELYKLAL